MNKDFYVHILIPPAHEKMGTSERDSNWVQKSEIVLLGHLKIVDNLLLFVNYLSHSHTK